MMAFSNIFDLYPSGRPKAVYLLDSSGADVLPAYMDCLLGSKVVNVSSVPAHPIETGNFIGDYMVDNPIQVELTPAFSSDEHYEALQLFNNLKDSRVELTLVDRDRYLKNLYIVEVSTQDNYLDRRTTAITVRLQEVRSARVKYSQTQKKPNEAQGTKSASAKQVKKPLTTAKAPTATGKVPVTTTAPAKATDVKRKMSLAKQSVAIWKNFKL